jgi:mannose-1-phosphate guanylyltransferase
MVLSAGFGTRLMPLTNELPKPLVPLANQPLLHRTLEKLHELGAEKLVVNVHHEYIKIVNSLNWLSFKVEVIHEVEIRGTAGGIAGAKSLLGGMPAIVVNGDIVGRLPVHELLAEPVQTLRMALCPRAPLELARWVKW